MRKNSLPVMTTPEVGGSRNCSSSATVPIWKGNTPRTQSALMLVPANEVVVPQLAGTRHRTRSGPAERSVQRSYREAGRVPTSTSWGAEQTNPARAVAAHLHDVFAWRNIPEDERAVDFDGRRTWRSGGSARSTTLNQPRGTADQRCAAVAREAANLGQAKRRKRQVRRGVFSNVDRQGG